MSWVLSYGCTSVAGRSSSEFWAALAAGKVPPALQAPEAQSGSAQNLLVAELFVSWQEALAKLPAPALHRLKDGRKMGVIFASTKGAIDDLVRDSGYVSGSVPGSGPDLHRDTLNPVLDSFLKLAELRPARRACVSNACTSALSAAFLAEMWLKSGACHDVIVLTADLAGEFVRKGFAVLRVLTTDFVRPFDERRSGFHLGSASAVIWLSEHQDESNLYLRGVGLEAEGHAVTRPSQTGSGLESAYRRIAVHEPPDLIIAHGTATVLNDAAEDQAYTRLFPSRPLITGAKWCVGHTLGASGGLDLIAAAECLKRETAFALATTGELDRAFRSRYALPGGDNLRPTRALISSLGFGGIHAAAVLERVS